MFTAILIYATCCGPAIMTPIIIPGFSTMAQCDAARYAITSNIEDASNVVPLGQLLISSNCVQQR